MKTKLFFFGLLCFNLSFGQNQSVQGVNPSITVAPGNIPLGPQFGSEIFRFRSGLVTQLDSGSNFGFTNQWFSLGRLTAGTQTFYGSRFQTPNNALVMGFTSTSPNNPRIEWIGNGNNTGNLEFRVGTGFGTPGNPGLNQLVASMTKEGNTIFGNPINANNSYRVSIFNNATNQFGSGLFVSNSASEFSEGLTAIARDGALSNLAVLGITWGTGAFEAGIYGETATNNNGNQFAGFFDGDVFNS